MQNNQLTKQDYFTPPELKILAASLGNDRDSLLIKLAIVTGARCSELLLLRKRDLNPTTNTVYIHATKNSNDREIRISADLMLMLQRLPTDRLFPFSTSRARYIWYAKRPVEITKHFHCFRHTFGVELYRATRDIMMVKKAMGHKTINSTMVYVECVDFDAKMEQYYPALDGLLKQS
jgi:integrase